RRERGNRGVRAVVAQVIDQNPALAANLRESFGEEIRLPSRQHLRECTGKVQALGPVGARRDRRYDVQPASAGRLDERREIQRLEHLSGESRPNDYGWPGDV